MRVAAGIPARVVTGYQGGSPGLGDYLIVRAADAHAWAEVWLEDRGWLRVDPTGAVAPERIEAGLGGSLGADEPVPYLARGGGDLLRRAQLAWDWANAGWNRWFLAYGPERQRDFLAGLGLPDVRSMILALTLLLTAVMALIGAILIWQARPRGAVDPVQAAWLRLCHRLAAAGLPRRDDEGPLDYAKRVARARPDCAATVGALAREYVAIRYRHGGSRQQRRAFIRDARRFRPRGAPRRPARI
ncbi:MAG: transglutaminase domain-containing protein [Salinisphaeraceae bacterium]